MTQSTAAPAVRELRETPSMGLSDHELMARCRRGDADALARLVARWQHSVARTLARMAPRSDVEDLCQEVFVRVHQARERYRPTGAFSTWLFAIVLNVGRDAARKAKRRRYGLWRHASPLEPEDPGASAELDLDDQRQIQAALAALPAELREVVALRHFGELTFAETAAVLRLPCSTVKSRFQAALEKLAWELRRRGLDPRDERP